MNRKIKLLRNLTEGALFFVSFIFQVLLAATAIVTATATETITAAAEENYYKDNNPPATIISTSKSTTVHENSTPFNIMYSKTPLFLKPTLPGSLSFVL